MTAMQELIEWIEEQREKHLIPTPYQIQVKAQDLLAKEREQIVEAWGDGNNCFTAWREEAPALINQHIQQPVIDGWRVYNTGVDITEQCTFESGVFTINSNVVHRG